MVNDKRVFWRYDGYHPKYLAYLIRLEKETQHREYLTFIRKHYPLYHLEGIKG